MSRYIDGRCSKKYYCKEEGCNNKISYYTYKYGQGNCKSCAGKKVYKITGNNLLKNNTSWNKNKKLTEIHVQKLIKAHLGQIPWNKDKINVYSKEMLIKMRNRKLLNPLRYWLNKKKELAPNWRGGLSLQIYPIGWTKRLRELIRERDNYECQLCNKSEKKNGRKLSVHHIDYDKENLDPNNLISLCTVCHSKTNFNREFWETIF